MVKKCKVLYGLEASDGGSLKHICYLLLNLDRTLFDLNIIISNTRSPRADLVIEQLKHSGIKVMVCPMMRSISPWKDLRSFLTIYLHLRKNTYDIVHAHSSKAGCLLRIAAWLNNTKCIIYTPHCFFFQSKKGLSLWFYALVERILSRITHFIIVSDNEKIAALSQRIARAVQLININNAIKFDDEDCMSVRYSIPNFKKKNGPTLIVGSMGRLTRQKDWRTFVLAADKVLQNFNNVSFVIAGDGEQLSELQLLIETLHLEENIFLVGYLPDPQCFYQIIDVFVSTSIWEGLPYSILEAMRYGKPIIATDLHYGPLIQNEISGYLVKTRDHQAVANALSVLLQNEPLRKTMGMRAKQHLQNKLPFTLFIKSHQQLYLKSFRAY